MVVDDQTDATDTTTNVENVKIVVNSVLDPSDPLYLDTSDNPRAMLVSTSMELGIGLGDMQFCVAFLLKTKLVSLAKSVNVLIPNLPNFANENGVMIW